MTLSVRVMQSLCHLLFGGLRSISHEMISLPLQSACPKSSTLLAFYEERPGVVIVLIDDARDVHRTQLNYLHGKNDMPTARV